MEILNTDNIKTSVIDSIDKMSVENKVEVVDIQKGIGIILMVIGHAGCPLWLHDWIYLFHMPLFFYVTGYLFKEKYVFEKIKYINRRFHSCYLNFLKYGYLFLIFHNLFYYIGFGTYYTLPQLLEQSIKIFLFSGNDSLLGPYWFLIEMFFASIIFLFVVCVVKYMNKNKKDRLEFMLYVLSLLIILLIAFLMSLLQIKIPKVSPKTFLAVSYMLVGLMYHKYNISIRPMIGLILLLSLFLIISFHIGAVEDNGMGVQGLFIFIYFLCSVIGILGMVGFTNCITGYLKKILIYIGSNSFYVLTFHLLFMVLIANLLHIMCGMHFYISIFPLEPKHVGLLWIPLAIAGIGGGLLMGTVIKRIKL